MARRSARILIGTSGWSYPHWRGPFYPRDLAHEAQLAFYAEHFESVEINHASNLSTPTGNGFRFLVGASPSLVFGLERHFFVFVQLIFFVLPVQLCILYRPKS